MRHLVFVSLLTVLTAFFACSPMVYTDAVPNLAQVDANIWRSGQITTQEGWDHIKQLANGRRVHVIKLNFDTEGSDDMAKAMGFDVHYFEIQPEGDQDIWDDVADTFRRPNEHFVDAAVTFLSIGAANSATDFWLVHCTHGQDRTGLIVGVYRVRQDHWSKERAYREMLDHNFHPLLYGLQEAWDAIVDPSVALPRTGHVQQIFR